MTAIFLASAATLARLGWISPMASNRFASPIRSPSLFPKNADDPAVEVRQRAEGEGGDEIACMDHQTGPGFVEKRDSPFDIRDVVVAVGHDAEFHFDSLCFRFQDPGNRKAKQVWAMEKEERKGPMNYFQLQERGSNVRTELLAGCTTFLTMCYIIFVNPLILAGTGMDTGAVLVATCLAAAFGSAVMGLYANYPIALAPGMGLNAYFAAVAVGTLGLPWQAALGAVFCSGVLMLVLSVLPVREWVVNSIPRSQKMAIAAGIGFFLVVIGLRNAGVVVADEATLVGLGDLIQWTVALAALGFMGIVALEHRQVPGSVVICILAAAAAGWVGGLSPAPESVVSAPPSLAPTAFALDIAAALEIGLIAIVFAFLMVDLFDTSGTLVAVLNEAGLTDKDGRVPGLRRALVADSSATMVGALVGTSTTTSYIESAAGVRAGGRTGLTALVVSGLFLVALVFAPVATAIPAYATAPAIIFVGCVMARALRHVEWDDLTEGVPAIVTAIVMPFTYSIATGIGLGFISYTVIKLLVGRRRDLNLAVVTVAVLFAIRFAVS